MPPNERTQIERAPSEKVTRASALSARLMMLAEDIKRTNDRLTATPIDYEDRARARAELVRKLRREADALDVARDVKGIGVGKNNSQSRWGRKVRGKNGGCDNV